MTTSTPDLNGTILVADDEESLRWVLAQTLEKRGHTVESVSDGARALAVMDAAVKSAETRQWVDL